MTLRQLITLFCLSLALPAPAAQSLQAWIDTALPGTVLHLPPGTYLGPARIGKPLSIEGNGKVIVDAGGHGTVLTIKADDVSVRGLILRGSGASHDAIDGGMMASGERLHIEDNVVEDVLFGISLHEARHSIVRHNRIRSRPFDQADRGDGIRIWYSTDNLIEDNDIAQVRDITVSNSPRNRFRRNTVRDSRRAFNFLFSHQSLVDRNILENNSTGIVVLNSDGLTIRHNRILHAMSPSGVGIALKETSSALVIGNEIVHCAHGIMADSPMDPVNRIVFVNNLIAHNVTGIYFYGVAGGHVALGNIFRNNLWQVSVSGSGATDSDFWQGNYWDDYEGFDRDGDGIGDQPHEIYAYADRIWMATPEAKFFRNSPVLELLDFLERLAPFSAPSRILRDAEPRIKASP